MQVSRKPDRGSRTGCIWYTATVRKRMGVVALAVPSQLGVASPSAGDSRRYNGGSVQMRPAGQGRTIPTSRFTLRLLNTFGMPAKPRVLVTGYNIRYPLGGQVAHNLNYLVGLQRLGCEVWYLEESGSWPSSCFNTTTREMTSDPSFGIAALKQLLRRFGIENNWVYVDEKRRYHNLSQPDRKSTRLN